MSLSMVDLDAMSSEQLFDLKLWRCPHDAARRRCDSSCKPYYLRAGAWWSKYPQKALTQGTHAARRRLIR